MPRFGKGFMLGRLPRLVQGFKRHPADNPLASTCLEKSYSFTRISLDLRVEGGGGGSNFLMTKTCGERAYVLVRGLRGLLR